MKKSPKSQKVQKVQKVKKSPAAFFFTMRDLFFPLW